MTEITIRYDFRLSEYSIPDDSLQTVLASGKKAALHTSCSASNRNLTLPPPGAQDELIVG